MGIAAIDHVNVRTAEPARAIAFYRDVLGMRFQPFPGHVDGARGGWMLDDGDHAAVHIGSAALAYPSDDAVPWQAGATQGALHHVALACTDRDAIETRLAAQGVGWTAHRIDAVELTQLFVIDPDGILLELNFHEP
ncbi:VOC family protein [Sphingomonas sanxanigenens]|uniref:VOC domain-containing protein n=1 Tax=Sphingomonas sanxanigenens DSM 19645 = NX02 TaxID=1123269 RepID=W0AC29_9SPHN|nr:VOC family protein [Sphingomonas sanxanigenens]AHE54626.1 hypothetical protein NX02_14710 [Sphingomonas sanxanigenens DSM 19645 = NX02]